MSQLLDLQQTCLSKATPNVLHDYNIFTGLWLGNPQYQLTCLGEVFARQAVMRQQVQHSWVARITVIRLTQHLKALSVAL